MSHYWLELINNDVLCLKQLGSVLEFFKSRSSIHFQVFIRKLESFQFIFSVRFGMFWIKKWFQNPIEVIFFQKRIRPKNFSKKFQFFRKNDCSATWLAKIGYKICVGIISMYHQCLKCVQSPRRNSLLVFSFPNEQCICHVFSWRKKRKQGKS